jgi:uncharacterized protein YaaR (DUF327 family)
MDKIDNYNFIQDFLPKKIQKDKLKKTRDLKSKKSVFFEKEESFDNIISSIEKDIDLKEIKKYQDELENILKNIGKQGEKLKKSRQLVDLENYKKLVRDYLKIFIALSEKKEKVILWDKRKKEKIAKVHLDIINKELQELTKIFFLEQQNTLKFAQKIDFIEGILIDLMS